VDFGSVKVGESADTLIHVINTSPRTLTGQPVFSSEAFSLKQERATITIEPGAVHDLHLRYRPRSPDAESASLRLGETCPAVSLTGRGIAEAPSPPISITARWTGSRGAEIEVRGTVWEEQGNAELRIYDILGRELHRTSLQSDTKTGSYLWPGTIQSGRRAAAGIYYVRVKVASTSAATSFLLLP
jgi:hypothetical protein